MTPRRALWILMVVSGLIRLVWAVSLGPGNDEAYHYLFTVHRDWSYFDHPPMLALVEDAGIALAGREAGALAIRLGFIALFAGSTWLMARLTERLFCPRAGFLAALALNVSAYHGVAAATFALPDGPLLFFWLLTLDRLVVALESPGRLGPWLGVGLAWGAAMLSKYHAVFLPAGTLLYVVLEPAARPWLRRAGPYLAFACGLALFWPVVWWNATHEWASFAFQGGRALGAARFRPDALAAAVLGQALYLFPWIWLALLTILIGRGRRFFSASTSAGERFLLCQAVVPLSAFLGVACLSPVLPHWTLVGYLSLFPMLGQVWAAPPGLSTRRRVVLVALPLLIGVMAVVQTRTGILQQGGHGTLGLVRVSRDPTLDLYGWDAVGRELERRGLLDRPNTFLFTSAWYYSGHLAFSTRRHATPVLCYNAWDARSFMFWSRPEDWVGQDGILVSLNGHLAEPHCFDRYFSSIEPLGSFEVRRAGAAVRQVRLFRCRRQTEPFPFDRHGRASGDRALARRPQDSSRPVRSR